MSKDYNENDAEPGGKASLPEQVKGKVDAKGASFKPLSHPKEGQADDENFPGFGEVKTGVDKPESHEKHLPKAGGLA